VCHLPGITLQEAVLPLLSEWAAIRCRGDGIAEPPDALAAVVGLSEEGGVKTTACLGR
jgi:hypothetical protein